MFTIFPFIKIVQDDIGYYDNERMRRVSIILMSIFEPNHYI